MTIAMHVTNHFALFDNNDRLSVRLYAADTLKAALLEIAQVFTRKYQINVNSEFDNSHLLRERILSGEKADIFIADDMKNPTALASVNKSSPVINFARNKICAIVKPSLNVTSDSLLNLMLDSEVQLAISTSDQSFGIDHIQDVFHKAEKLQTGNFERLNSKILHLDAKNNFDFVPDGKNKFAYFILETQQVDVCLSYYTEARLACLDAPQLQIIEIPENLAVKANYGMTLISNSHSYAVTFAMYILSVDGQKILNKYGFHTAFIG